jgi:hypothetical protein
MNDSPTSRSEKISVDDKIQPATEIASSTKVERREMLLESQTENISLPPDKLNDLFLEAELTARQKASTELERLRIENQKLQIENQV